MQEGVDNQENKTIRRKKNYKKKNKGIGPRDNNKGERDTDRIHKYQ